MQILQGPTESPYPCILALGNFDGVHLGHRRLLETGLKEAKRRQLPMGVLIFHPHPEKILFPSRKLELLTTPQQQKESFNQLGIDFVYELDFNMTMASRKPEEFVQEVLIPLGVVHVIIGFNYSFGTKGTGTPSLLRRLGKEMGFEVTVVEPQLLNGQVISSSRIRRALSEGNIELARAMLGHTPSIEGTVVKGDQRGRTIGYPTANIETEEEIIIPQKGVYVVDSEIDGKTFNGMMNIGTKPTFYNTLKSTVEVHLFDFNLDIYNKKLKINIHERIRDEVKFENINCLKEQLERDAIFAKRFYCEIN